MKIYLAVFGETLSKEEWSLSQLNVSNNGVVTEQLPLIVGKYEVPDFTDEDLGDIQQWLDRGSFNLIEGVYHMIMLEDMKEKIFNGA